MNRRFPHLMTSPYPWRKSRMYWQRPRRIRPNFLLEITLRAMALRYHLQQLRWLAQKGVPQIAGGVLVTLREW